ncbi:cytochrome c biogenesis ATP-binding export protein CcmA [mine drainage metagenome]|uniref:Cytochrome c biogenesis ATP-binding export protein CcmA n=1 Tax=mine drainage metagenome TaxID=410659 RepID=A0A1J5QV43_9ZZZZ
MLKVDALVCQRGGRRLFENLSFVVGPGELVHVQGVNGSGKTSLLRILTGLSMPDAGEVRWMELDIRQSRDSYVAHLLYLGHHPAVKDDLSVEENLQVSSRLAGVDPAAVDIGNALEATGLKNRAKLPARVLSQGQRRRLALARLWLDRRMLWVLDEPFTALDVHATRLLEHRMEQHLSEGGMVVLTSHQQPLIAERYLRTLSIGA